MKLSKIILKILNYLLTSKSKKMTLEELKILWRKFTKTNKVNRESLAKRQGFSSAEEYQAHLKLLIAKAEKKSSLKTVKVKVKEKNEKITEKVEKPIKIKIVKTEEKNEESGNSSSKNNSGKLDLVIAFDTTGSMDSYIHSVKSHVTSLIPKLFSENPDLNISIVAFGDYCDMKDKDNFDKAYQYLPLTDNQEKIKSFIGNARKTRGGDSDEFYELVIRKINRETNWRKNSEKAVLFIADASPHSESYKYYDFVKESIDWREEAQEAKKLGIKYDTLKIFSYIKWYEELSQITGGVSLDFSSSNKTQDLVEATVLARGGERTKKAFEEKARSVEKSGDVELSSVYSTYRKIRK